MPHRGVRLFQDEHDVHLARQARDRPHLLQGRHPRLGQEQGVRQGGDRSPRPLPLPQRNRARPRYRPHRHRREPLRRHQIPRRLRNPRRNNPPLRPHRHRVHRHGPRGHEAPRHAHAQVRRDRLQRLLVLPGNGLHARRHRQIPGTHRRLGRRRLLQGTLHGHRPRLPMLPLLRRPRLHGVRRRVRPRRRRRLHPRQLHPPQGTSRDSRADPREGPQASGGLRHLRPRYCR
mmetsp:Transcript_27456/g.68950  ORF Transcript_27456/g.68950 Transcript_27456/m.68950 type:complete len:231 (-) Transcript_27456:134-826(-)